MSLNSLVTPPNVKTVCGSNLEEDARSVGGDSICHQRMRRFSGLFARHGNVNNVPTKGSSQPSYIIRNKMCGEVDSILSWMAIHDYDTVADGYPGYSRQRNDKCKGDYEIERSCGNVKTV